MHAHSWTGYFRFDLLLVTWECDCGERKYNQIGRSDDPKKVGGNP